jgi:hypothetical protein
VSPALVLALTVLFVRMGEGLRVSRARRFSTAATISLPSTSTAG